MNHIRSDYPEQQQFWNNWIKKIFIDSTFPKLDYTYNHIQKHSSTDYLDRFTWDEVTNPIMIGTDNYRRKFLILKLIIDNTKYMQTFFQRYTDNNLLWMGCGHATNEFLSTIGGLKIDEAKLIVDIIEGKEIILNNDHRIFQDNINKKVMLYDEEKHIAANKIKNYWFNCKFNPEYKICREFLDRSYKILLNDQ